MREFELIDKILNDHFLVTENDFKYKSQLDASKLFIDHIIVNAERRNGYQDFDSSSIIIRRVKIIAAPINKLTTKPRLKALSDER